jgi:uncharacterized protein
MTKGTEPELPATQGTEPELPATQGTEPELPATQGTEPELPAPAPVVNVETRPFWDATAEGRLLLVRCDGCGETIWYPRGICPACRSTATSWFEASGRGEVYSFTVVRRGQGAYRDAGPYVLAYVELEEGPRIMTNIVGSDTAAVRIGQPVEVVFHDTGAGSALPRFHPV